MLICQAGNGFYLDELMKKVADDFENKAFADILKINLQFTQEALMYRIFYGKSNLQCCSDEHLTLNGSFDRRIRTSWGGVQDGFLAGSVFKMRQNICFAGKLHWLGALSNPNSRA